MRHVFINELIKESKKDKDIYLITADLGFKAFEKFQKEFPERFINLGVAENNMIGVGAGMALKGKKVFVYSILPFLVFDDSEACLSYFTKSKGPFDLLSVPLDIGFDRAPGLQVRWALNGVDIWCLGRE